LKRRNVILILVLGLLIAELTREWIEYQRTWHRLQRASQLCVTGTRRADVFEIVGPPDGVGSATEQEVWWWEARWTDGPLLRLLQPLADDAHGHLDLTIVFAEGRVAEVYFGVN